MQGEETINEREPGGFPISMSLMVQDDVRLCRFTNASSLITYNYSETSRRGNDETGPDGPSPWDIWAMVGGAISS